MRQSIIRSKRKQIQSPDYKMIFTDIIRSKCPEKESLFKEFLNKDKFSSMDVINLNQLIFKANKTSRKHRSYDKADIIKILEYQKKHQLNNFQLAEHFQISRNTVTSWKKKFLI